MSEWIEKSEKILEEIRGLHPKDRLGLVSAIAKCNIALARSVNGWAVWLGDPRVMEKISEEDLKEIFGKFREIALKFIAVDVEFTRKYATEKPSQSSRNVLVV